jgi:hypothetical protein
VYRTRKNKIKKKIPFAYACERSWLCVCIGLWSIFSVVDGLIPILFYAMQTRFATSRNVSSWTGNNKPENHTMRDCHTQTPIQVHMLALMSNIEETGFTAFLFQVSWQVSITNAQWSKTNLNEITLMKQMIMIMNSFKMGWKNMKYSSFKIMKS